MNYNADIFVDQFPIVARFVQHLAYYRASKPTYDRLKLESPFWCASIDAHLKVAAMEWCKVFGADGCNSTHWKHLPTTDHDTLLNSFRSTVMSGLAYSKKEWDRYHKAMCDFRNKYVAHHEQGFSQPVPDFDTALQIAYAYDEWIRELIRPDVYTGPRLREEFEAWRRQATPLAEKAMIATDHMKE